ncbi:MAG: cytochrome c family protein [Alphaproteobacteria bacterium]|nr:MAG: cytochrome c family protein [Alphaproteobacteria bacterium]
MSAREINKIAGAILMALIIIKVADLAGDAVGQAQPLAKPAYLAAAAAAPGAKTEAKAAADKPGAAGPGSGAAMGPLLAAASAESGKSLARKCTTCHSLKKDGKNKVGPALWGVVGAQKAGRSFRYSSALKGLGGVWDYAALNAFLASPKAFAPGNKMPFAGIKRAADRAALILYLRSLSDSPLPLP